jgi:hypothetical protein
MKTPWSSRFAVAWTLSLAPVFLFIPAFWLAGMGPCAFSHPLVIMASCLLFAGLEIAAVSCFAKASRSAGNVVVALIGIVLAVVLLALNLTLEYYFVADYWMEMHFG